MQIGIIGISNEKAKELMSLISEDKGLYISSLYDCNCSGMIGCEFYGKKVGNDILDLFASSDVVVDLSNHKDKSKELVLACEMETKYIILGEVKKDNVFDKACQKGKIVCCDSLDAVMKELNE